MRLEDMKSDIPETPDFIHKMIQNEVAKQIQDTKVMNLQRRKTWTIPKIAAVAAACTLAVSTAAYAAPLLRCKSVSLVSGEAGRLWCSG